VPYGEHDHRRYEREQEPTGPAPHAGAEHELQRQRDEQASRHQQEVLVPIHRGHSVCCSILRPRMDEGVSVGSAPVSASPAIEVAGLSKRYGAVRALEGLSLTVEPGEVFGLLGPNGAGKTTIVEILEGYRKRDAGDVTVLGIDPRVGGRKLRERV